MNGVIVQKFGGTSVADADKLRASARHVLGALSRQSRVVVVVSAMGDATDELLELARTIPLPAGHAAHDPRELDQLLATGEQAAIAMMALTLRSLGVRATSLTGQQAQIRVDAVHGRASICEVGASRLTELLDAGVVPVVAGFQGVTSTGDVATLGRGGSDTTAVAIAARLGGCCEIYKDVDGVYTADPRVVPEARRLEHVSYDEMLEAASLGSQVIHPRAVELARKFKVPVRVLHSQRDPAQGPGTLVVLDEDVGESRVVSNVVLKRGVGRLSLRGLRNEPGVQSRVLGPIAAAHVPLDDIIQEDDGSPGAGTVNLTMTLDTRDLRHAESIVRPLVDQLGASSLRVDTGLCTVSAVGDKIRTMPGVAAQMFGALADDGILVQNITTSEIRISCVLSEGDGERAARCVHRAFGMDRTPDARPPLAHEPKPPVWT